MKALSLWQPWASLLLIADPLLRKHNETRAWATTHTGPLAIQAALNKTQLHLVGEEPFKSSLASIGIHQPGDFPLGKVIGVVRQTGCVRVDRHGVLDLSERERAFGDYSHGRYYFPTDWPLPFPTPIPVRGRRKMFDWVPPAELHDLLARWAERIARSKTQ